MILLLTAAALLTGAAVAFPKIFGIFEWVSMIPLILVLNRCADNGDVKKKHCYAFGLLYFEIFYMVCFHFFLYMYPLDFTGLDEVGSVLAIAVAWLGLPLLQALFGGFVFVAYVSVARSRLAIRFPWVRFLSLPVIYTFYEFTQTLGWWGVPWGRLPIGQTELILPVQTASLFGSYFVTFILVLVNCLIYHATVRISTDRKAYRPLIAAALAVFILNIGIGGALYPATRAKEKTA
jgi:apolipoprotein N-acyltransferase